MAEAGAGLMGSIRQLLSTVTSIASTRLELLANEVQEERLRLTQMLLFTLFALFCFGVGILLLTAFIVVLFWDDHRLAVLGALSALFFALGALTAMLLRSKAQAKPRLFSASLAELIKDRAQLETGHE
ncbi:MAG: phage holin family protein [Nitrosomonadales bacterium]|nr:phage holin family protein [Nitrosomonadales bacterium]